MQYFLNKYPTKCSKYAKFRMYRPACCFPLSNIIRHDTIALRQKGYMSALLQDMTGREGV